ncbi:MAG: Orotidine 5'-phosphate decarboxylase [Planctomycetes bacterium]|nr:Orotidine 5'-phosphate decarboxylase [Planctomycetota bacterium]
MPRFADRLAAAVRAKGSAVCVGIDPRPGSLPSEFRPARDTPAAHAEAVGAWGIALVEAVAPLVPVVKPQLAFFECFGAPGFRAYHDIVLAAQERNVLVIADAKRGDIGSTAQAYAEAHFDTVGADAITVNPYLGRDSIEPFLPYANRGKGIYVLVKTSNPGSADLQDLAVEGGGTLHARVARMVHELGAEASQRGESGWSSVGAVVGATHPRELAALREAMPRTPLLIPGYGAQGGSASDCAAGFADDGASAVVNSSRGITFAFRSGDHAARFGDARWRDSARAAVIEMRDALEAARRAKA